MILALYERRGGIETAGGPRVVYDVGRDEAHFGAAQVDGRALVWEVGGDGAGAKLAAEVELDPATEWLVRCDRIDFPPGGEAYLHTHPGPGIRCLLFGGITIETDGRTHAYGPFEAWFESGPSPVHAVAAPDVDSAFVRVLLLPREWEGRRTIRYVNADDEQRPKLQRARVYLEVPLGR